MERRTVQMALMRMGVPSSVTPQVGPFFSPLHSWVILCQGLWLLPDGIGGLRPWKGLSASWALMLVMWFLLSLALSWRCCQKGAKLTPLFSDLDVAELRLPWSPCLGPRLLVVH